MDIAISLIVFLLIAHESGYWATAKSTFGSRLEAILIRLGLGLAVIPLLCMLFHLIGIPFKWWIFLYLATISLLLRAKKWSLSLFKCKWGQTPFSEKLVLLIFIIHLGLYLYGALSQYWLEDADPPEHAMTLTYIVETGSLYEPIPGKDILHYTDAYPPGFDVLLSIPRQIWHSSKGVLKVYTSLVISLGLLFFYWLAVLIFNDKKKALFATFLLASIPCYLSRFIWSHALAVTLFIITLYCILRLKEKILWLIPSAIAIGAIGVTTATQGVKVAWFLIIYLIVVLVWRQWSYALKILLAGVLSVAISFIWWGPMIAKYGLGPKLIAAQGAGHPSIKQSVEEVAKGRDLWEPLFSRKNVQPYYDIQHILFPDITHNNSASPYGIGLAMAILVLIFIFSILKTGTATIFQIPLLIWLIFSFIGAMSLNTPFEYDAFRFWQFFAIFASLAGAEGMWLILKASTKKWVLPTCILLIIWSGATVRYGININYYNTSHWWPSGFLGKDDLNGYFHLIKNLPEKAGVFPLAGGYKSWLIVGTDREVKFWRQDEQDFFESHLKMIPDQIANWLNKHKYRFIIIDGLYKETMGEEQHSKLASELMSSPLFRAWYNNGTVFCFEVIN